jgi:CreA protein
MAKGVRPTCGSSGPSTISTHAELPECFYLSAKRLQDANPDLRAIIDAVFRRVPARRGESGRGRRPLGLNEDPSNFSVTCRQMGPIAVELSTLPDSEEAFSEKTSIFFKKTRIYRIPDRERNTLVYVAISAKLVDGSPANSVSAVPIMAWPK